MHLIKIMNNHTIKEEGKEDTIKKNQLKHFLLGTMARTILLTLKVA